MPNCKRSTLPPFRRPLWLVVATGASLLAGLAIGPATALAGTASVSGTQLVVSASANQTNNIAVTVEGPNFRVAETGGGATLSAGAGCSPDIANQVLCPIAGIISISISASNQDDFVTVNSSTPTTINGGDDDDILSGGTGADTINGGNGSDWASYAGRGSPITADLDGVADDGGAGENDTIATDVENLTGGNGNDTLTGNSGWNAIDGGPGADAMSGGSGSDWVVYSSRTAGVTVDLDGVADDGEAGENDTIATDVENLTGGSGNDTLVGDSQANALDGGLGGDSLSGGAGSDWVLYWTRSAAVTVDIDGVADDGQTGESDNVGTDVENLIGGNGNDTLTGSSDANIIFGDDGTNTLNGLGGDDYLLGDTGPDAFNGGTGLDLVSYAGRNFAITADPDGVADDGQAGENDNVGTDVENLTGGDVGDTLTGSSTDNVLDGGPGADALNGGSNGVDTASYASRSSAVSADADGLADDGAAGENDNIATNVENLTGGAGNDTLTGNAAANVLDGHNGADTLTGGTGIDTATYASRSAAVVADADGVADDGEAGESDNVATDVENLTGGAGNDTLTGNAVANVLVGGAGDDSLLSRDGIADQDDCGTGTDVVVADVADVATADCEQVDRGITTAVPPASSPTVPTVPTVPIEIAPRAVTLTPGGVALVKVTCATGGASCTGTLTLTAVLPARRASASRRSRPTTIGKQRFEVAAGRSKRVPVRISRRARALVRKSRTLKVNASTVIQQGSERKVIRQSFKLRAPKRAARRR